MAGSFGIIPILCWGRENRSINIINTVAGEPDIDGDHQVTVKIRYSRTPSFAAENDTRIQRVLDIATNKILSEKVRPSKLTCNLSSPATANILYLRGKGVGSRIKSDAVDQRYHGNYIGRCR